MTRAEKAEMMKKFEAERAETQRVIEEARSLSRTETETEAKAEKCFELDGWLVSYKTGERVRRAY